LKIPVAEIMFSNSRREESAMISYNDYLTVQTKQKREFLNITANCRAALEKSGIHNGLMLVMALHSNSGLFLGDDEPGLLADVAKWLDTLAPERDDYQHQGRVESNAGVHLQAVVLGSQVALAVTEGKLELGPWQHILYAELDGMRPKKIVMKIIGE
jgi:secondary thiamine-phosphate synthase enzyme